MIHLSLSFSNGFRITTFPSFEQTAKAPAPRSGMNSICVTHPVKRCRVKTDSECSEATVLDSTCATCAPILPTRYERSVLSGIMWIRPKSSPHAKYELHFCSRPPPLIAKQCMACARQSKSAVEYSKLRLNRGSNA